ncbi:Wzz/FepE/Etk N-terminal domain-containing protein [Streptomyces sp. NPDC047072]|uniref:Wzz/FepE/Etk N-terminal domain-containing protein n=1 Tax=Streptomyces sp. NPDC047072 TaxID=3154809 RepID=UPI0033DC110D
MDLRAYVRLFLRHWVAIVLLAVLGTAAGAALAWLKDPLYAAKAEMIVTVDSPGSDLAQAYQGALLAEERAQSYSTVLTSDQVLEALRDRLDLPYSVEKLRSEIEASNPASTAIIKVTVEDTSAQRAKDIAAAVGPVFAEVVVPADVTGNAGGGAGSDTVVGVDVLQPVRSPAQPVSQHQVLDIALGLAIGLVLGIGLAVIREITDRRLRDAEDVARASDVSVLAVVPHERAGRRKTLSPDTRLPLPVVEAYRLAAVGLRSAGSGDRRNVYAVAAPTDAEDAAGAALGLAIALAQGGDSVVLVDADPLSTRVALLMALPGAVGLADVLDGRVALDRALQQWRTDLPLRVLVAGGPDARALDAAVLQEHAFDALCEELEQRADVVVLAAPAVLTRADAAVVARVAGQAVIVVRAKGTRGDELDASVQSLRAHGVAVLGAVISDPARRSDQRPVWSVPREYPRTGAQPGEETAPRVTPRGSDRSPASPPDERHGDHLVSLVRR